MKESRVRWIKERLTFLPGRVVWVQIPADRHHFDDQVVSPMSDHIDHLLVANLYHVVLVDLGSEEEEEGQV